MCHWLWGREEQAYWLVCDVRDFKCQLPLWGRSGGSQIFHYRCHKWRRGATTSHINGQFKEREYKGCGSCARPAQNHDTLLPLCLPLGQLIRVIRPPDNLSPHHQTIMSMVIPSPLSHGNPFTISIMAQLMAVDLIPNPVIQKSENICSKLWEETKHLLCPGCPANQGGLEKGFFLLNSAEGRKTSGPGEQRGHAEVNLDMTVWCLHSRY